MAKTIVRVNTIKLVAEDTGINLHSIEYDVMCADEEGYKKRISGEIPLKSLTPDLTSAALVLWKYLKASIENEQSLEPLPDPIIQDPK